jgi:RNA polymerase sigma-70 factor, ECF subfamily
MAARVEEGVWSAPEPEDTTVAALGRAYERGYPRFLRVAEAIVRDEELARDVVQDAFAHALRSCSDYRGDGSLEGWIWRIVVNTARNAVRDRLRSHLPLHEIVAEQETSNGRSRGSELRALLAMLPERQRLVLFLRYYADLDYRRIAEVLDIQPGTVGATLNQAHAAVRRALEEVPR